MISVGPKCEQVKPGDEVLLMDNAIQRVYPVHHGGCPKVYAIKEDQVIGIAD